MYAVALRPRREDGGGGKQGRKHGPGNSLPAEEAISTRREEEH